MDEKYVIYQDFIHKSLFPILSKKYDNTETICLISSYQNIINEIIE